MWDALGHKCQRWLASALSSRYLVSITIHRADWSSESKDLSYDCSTLIHRMTCS